MGRVLPSNINQVVEGLVEVVLTVPVIVPLLFQPLPVTKPLAELVKLAKVII